MQDKTKLLKDIKNLPDSPGVYLFYDKEGFVLYIGKATSLKNRVSSYLDKNISSKRSTKIERMIFLANNVKYKKTDSVLEALMLENILIKKYNPPYNTKEKDDKSYNLVIITKEKFPRLLQMRVKEYEKKFVDNKNILNKNNFNNKQNNFNNKINNTKNNDIVKSTSIADINSTNINSTNINTFENVNSIKNDIKVDQIFGPFTSGTQLREAVKIIRKIFPFRDRCPVGEKENTCCFNYFLGLCPGTCCDKISEKEYKENIKYIKMIFYGKQNFIIKDLQKKMQSYAKDMNFERAALMRNTIFTLNHIKDFTLIKDENINEWKDKIFNKKFRIESYDVAHISGKNRVGVVAVVEDGKVNKEEYRMFKLKEDLNDDYAGLVEILKRRFKHQEWTMPDMIVFDGGKGQKNIGDQVLASLNLKIETCSVVKDSRHKAKDIISNSTIVDKENVKKAILLANSEAHRFAINYHKKIRDKIK